MRYSAQTIIYDLSRLAPDTRRVILKTPKFRKWFSHKPDSMLRLHRAIHELLRKSTLVGAGAGGAVKEIRRGQGGARNGMASPNSGGAVFIFSQRTMWKAAWQQEGKGQ